MYIKNDRSELVLSLLNNLSVIKVVTDLGCMDGATLNGMATKMQPNVSYFGVDHAIKPTQQETNVVSFKEYDLNTDLSGLENICVKTDLFLLLDVLEHLYISRKISD